MTVRVRLLGRPRIVGDRQPRGHKSWAVLARIALSDRPLTRAELAGELFGEADDPLAALRWCLADLRRCTGETSLLRGDPLTLDGSDLDLDVWSLWDSALPPAEVGAVLLDGVDLRNCPSFEVWLLLARGRCGSRSMEELRRLTLLAMAAGTPQDALEPAGRAAALDALDEAAQELFLRTLVAAGLSARATVYLAGCEAAFAEAGLTVPPAMRAAAQPPSATARSGVRAAVVAASLRQAGAAAIDAGSVDAGVETLRRAAEEAVRADDSTLRGGVLLTLGSALVHSLRGYDGEGAIVLHQAIAAAREADDAPLTAEILRELAFVDVQAGRHTSADRALDEATAIAAAGDDRGLRAGLLALRGMNRADLGHHAEAVRILEESAALAVAAERPRQVAWSVGLMARSLLLAGRVRDSMRATERSIEICSHERWNAFLPWPQAVRAHGLASAGDWGAAHDQAEHAFALACEIGDPCWEGMAGRALALTALHAGNDGTAQAWIVDARARSDRVTDRYVWVSAFVALGQIEIAARCQPDLVAPLAQRLYDDAVRADLPEFIAWALTYQAADDRSLVSLAVRLAGDVTNPELSRRLEELTGPG
ncbi:MAG TPA: hypothetical protein VGJ28_03045 [Micromonosporaceae bacterium]